MTDTAPSRAHDELLLRARSKLERQAERLSALLGPGDTGATLIAVGAALLTGAYGKHTSVALLREAADEVDGDEPPVTAGRA